MLARIAVWGVGAKVRASLMKLAAALVGAAIVLVILLTAAAWTTTRLLAGLSALLGGGLIGAVLAVTALLALILIIGQTLRVVSRRKRAAEWRRRLDPAQSPKEESSPAQEELDKLSRETRRELDRDKDRLQQHGKAIWRLRPLTTLGVGAASGFLTSRWVMAAPRNIRRRAVGVLRLAKSMGLAGLAKTLSQSLRTPGPSTPGPATPGPSTQSPTSTVEPAASTAASPTASR